jgi:hypothetical protein
MISRRFFFQVLACATATGTVQAADAAAQAFVESIYAGYKGKNPKGVSIATNAQIRKYFEPSLATLIINDAAAAKKRGDVPDLDGDPFVDAQDFEIDRFIITFPEAEADKALAQVSFTNAGEAKVVKLSLTKVKAGWRIADIDYGEGRTLRQIFKK